MHPLIKYLKLARFLWGKAHTENPPLWWLLSVGTLSSTGDSSVLGSALWNWGCLCGQAPWSSLQELIRRVGFFLDCLKISSFYLAHRAHFGDPNVFTTLMGFPCHRILFVMLFCWRGDEGCLKFDRIWQSVWRRCQIFCLSLTSLKCSCILFLKILFVLPM